MGHITTPESTSDRGRGDTEIWNYTASQTESKSYQYQDFH